MEHTISLPVKYLAALRLLTADKKENRRPCLRGVAVREGMLMATNGTYAGVIDLKLPEVDKRRLPVVIFPNEIIDLFVKKIGRTNLGEAQVDIVWEDDGGKTLKFLSPSAIEIGRAMDDVYSYPDVRRTLNTRMESEGFAQFPWHQLALFEKVAELLGVSKKTTIKALVIPNGLSIARVVVPECPAFNGAIMPINIDTKDHLIENGFSKHSAAGVSESAEDLV